MYRITGIVPAVVLAVAGAVSTASAWGAEASIGTPSTDRGNGIAAMAEPSIPSTPASASLQPAEFKGLRLGEKLDVQKLKDDWQFRCDPLLQVVEVCDGYTSIAGAEAYMTTSVTKDLVLQRIRLSFKSREFAQVIRALTEKYGRPYTDEATQVRSGLGVLLPQRKLRWRAAAGAQVLALLRSKDIETAMVVFSSAQQLAADEVSVDDPLKRQAADL